MSDPFSDEDLIFLISQPRAGLTLMQAVLAGGDRITDADAGALEGLAVTGVDDTNGTWQYSTDGGTSWLAFGAVSDNAAVLLDTAAKVRFVPDADYTGTAGDVPFRAWDRTAGANGDTGVDVSTNGGATAFSTATDVAAITVTAANDTPTTTGLADVTVAEDAADSVVDLFAAFADVEDLDPALTYTITTATGNGTLRLSGTALGVSDTFTQADIDAGLVTYDHDGSETVSDSFDFGVDDGAGTSSSGTFNFTVTPVNDEEVVAANTGTTVIELPIDAAAAGRQRRQLDLGIGQVDSSTLANDPTALDLGQQHVQAAVDAALQQLRTAANGGDNIIN